MSYQVTPEDLASTTDAEIAFGATRLLPKPAEIPEEFWRGNLYTNLSEAIFFGRTLPSCDIEIKAGFEAAALNRAVRAHLASFEPKHEHKIAGVGFLIASVATLHRNP